MFEQKIFEATPESVKELKKLVYDDHFTIFNLAIDRSTVHVCFIATQFNEPSGRLCFGGEPTGIMFGVLHRGWFWFDSKVHPDYLGEKLAISNEPDCRVLSEFVNLWLGEA